MSNPPSSTRAGFIALALLLGIAGYAWWMQRPDVSKGDSKATPKKEEPAQNQVDPARLTAPAATPPPMATDAAKPCSIFSLSRGS